MRLVAYTTHLLMGVARVRRFDIGTGAKRCISFFVAFSVQLFLKNHLFLMGERFGQVLSKRLFHFFLRRRDFGRLRRWRSSAWFQFQFCTDYMHIAQNYKIRVLIYQLPQ